MESINYYPSMTSLLVKGEIFRDYPFSLIDVGCGLGIHPVWRTFDKQLIVNAFDPRCAEIERLKANEKHPGVNYHACFVGLDENHPYRKKKAVEDKMISDYYNPWARLSYIYAAELCQELEKQTSAIEKGEVLATKRIGVSEVVRQKGLDNIDFIKSDTDGSDLEVAISCEEIIRPAGVLGFMIEALLSGSYLETECNFSNIDRFMKQQGFQLMKIEIHSYSRRSLPARFKYNCLGQTLSGQPLWGDCLYLRDAGSPQYEEVWGEPLPIHKALKIACVFEIFSLPDCAAEIIKRYENEISKLIKPSKLLDALTPEWSDRKVSYEEYMKLFRDDPRQFFTTLHATEKNTNEYSAKSYQPLNLLRMIKNVFK